MAAAIIPSPSSSSSTPKVTPKTVRNAVNALLKCRSSKSETQKPKLLDSDELLYLVVALKKIPGKGRVNAYKLPLPTPLHSTHTEFCLIYDDRPKSTLTKPHIQSKIKADNLPIVKILKYTKLKSDYKAFESKRKLLNSYDMFLADKQIVPLLPRLLGKHFFKKKRIPVPVDLLKKNWKEQVERICGSALLFLSTGTCSVVRVARTSMKEEEIVENVVAAVDGVAEVVEGGWEGVRALHLKLLESVPLPVYQTLPDEKLKAEEEKKDVEGVTVESKEEKVVGKKKKGMIGEVKNLDSNVVDEDEEVSGGVVEKPKRKKEEKLVGEPNGKASESDVVDGGELRKSKRNKKVKVDDVVLNVEKPVKKSKSAKVKDDEVLDVEKPVKKSAKVKDDVVLNVEKPVKKSAKVKDDVVLNVEKPKKLGKVKIDAGVIPKPKNDESSVKDKKKDIIEKKGEELAGKVGEALGKKEKRKSEPVKLKSEEEKLKKTRRSK